MFLKPNHCPACGYGPIPPLTDNCPMCAQPVRTGTEGGSLPLPPGKIACLVGILLLHAYLFFDLGLMLTVVLCMAPCFAFLIAGSQRFRPSLRLLAASFLVLAVVGLWFASRNVYPRLGGMLHLPPNPLFRDHVIMNPIRPSMPVSRLGARMFYWYMGMYLLYGVVLVPPYLFLTVLGQRRRPWFSRRTCWVGLAVWLLVLGGLATQLPKLPRWLDPPGGVPRFWGAPVPDPGKLPGPEAEKEDD
jgi:hypothetical protein